MFLRAFAALETADEMAAAACAVARRFAVTPAAGAPEQGDCTPAAASLGATDPQGVMSLEGAPGQIPVVQAMAAPVPLENGCATHLPPAHMCSRNCSLIRPRINAPRPFYYKSAGDGSIYLHAPLVRAQAILVAAATLSRCRGGPDRRGGRRPQVGPQFVDASRMRPLPRL